MDTRYQVFVSSTYRDLQDERREVMQALLEMNCFPAGMELFPATDDDAWTLIKGVISQSDYYLIAVAGRYGSVDDAGLSYTEKEYDLAYSLGKPVAAFLHESPGEIPIDDCDSDPLLRQRLFEFRDKLKKRHHCKYWTSAEDLGGKVARSLNMLIKSKPAIGWVKADTVSPDLLQRLDEARQELEQLRQVVDETSPIVPDGAEDFAQGSDMFSIHCVLEPSGWNIPKGIKSKHRKCEMSWDEAFRIIGPKVSQSAEIGSIKSSFNASLLRMLARDGETVEHRTAHVDADDFTQIIYQFIALGLVREICEERTSERRGVRRAVVYKLTPLGKQRLFNLLATKRLRAIA